MKFSFRKNNRAASIIEYVILIIMFLAAMLLMQKRIVRTFFDRWKQAGDTFSYGEQYDPNNTIECGRYVNANNPEVWYLESCYQDCMDGIGTPACSGVSDKRGCCATTCPACPY